MSTSRFKPEQGTATGQKIVPRPDCSGQDVFCRANSIRGILDKLPIRIALTLTVCCLTTSALAQLASVRGFVSDSTSHEVLAGVNIVLTLQGGDIVGAAADAD